ncbi:MAG: hypothetical protein KDA60_19880 [Planctomycetales bacterium]|nr:hypothetical protein [Planctomycetales bacterium]
MKTRTYTNAATEAELLAAMPNADAEFVNDMLARGASLTDALKIMVRSVDSRNAKMREDQDFQRRMSGRPTLTRGNAAINESGGHRVATGSAFDEFTAAVNERVKAGMSKQEATRAAIKEDPDRHAAYLSEYNAKHPIHSQ